MILLLVVTVAALSMSTANPMAPLEAAIKSISIRQMSNCDGIIIPGDCIQAANNYSRAFQEITSNGTGSPDSARRLLMAIRTYLTTACSSECLVPTLRAADCLNNQEARNLTANLLCSQNEDGAYCPVKVLEEVTRNGTTGPIPICAFGNTCDSSCRQSYLDIRSRLGCCAASWYGNSSGSPLSTFGENFATCNVSLTNPCTPASGAATICLNFLLLAVVFLLSVAMN